MATDPIQSLVDRLSQGDSGGPGPRRLGSTPQITAERAAAVPQSPDVIPLAERPDISGAGQQLGQRIARIGAMLQESRDEASAQLAFQNWVVTENQFRTSLFSFDPFDPERQLPDYREAGKLYKDGVEGITAEVAETHKLTNGARAQFRFLVNRQLSQRFIDVNNQTMKRGLAFERSQIDTRIANTLAIMRGLPEADRVEQIQLLMGNLERNKKRGVITEAEQTALQTKFTVGLLDQDANEDIRSTEGRERFYAEEAAGRYNALGDDRRFALLGRAHALESRSEAQDRENEKALANERENRKIEVGELIAADRREEALDLVSTYARYRLLSAAEIEGLRKDIAEPARERTSDPVEAQRIGLDTASINPRTSEAEIDGLVERQRQGGRGLTLKDGLIYKNRLRETREGLASAQRTTANRAEDQARTRLSQRHSQAEQELRAALGVKQPFGAEAALQNPSDRAYAVLLPELRARSSFFGGREDPIDVVQSMRPRIRELLGTPTRLEEIYKDHQSLEEGHRKGAVSDDAYQKELKRRGPPLPPAKPFSQMTPQERREQLQRDKGRQ